MLFDFAAVPFSRFGRFLTLSTMKGAVYLRSVKGGDLRPGLGRLCHLRFHDALGKELTPEYELSPTRLVAKAPGGRIEFAIGAGERLHIRGAGLGVTFHLEGSRYDYAYLTPQGEHCLVAAYENVRLTPRVKSGTLKVAGDWRVDHSDAVSFAFSGADGFEGSVELFEAMSSGAQSPGFDQVCAEVDAAFASWLARTPQVGAELARQLAAYLLWANTVPAAGILTTPAIYMSKNSMINIWSWDNAFSALGVLDMDPALAFGQFAAIFDHQHVSGLLPDFVNDRVASFAFTKPPVHGWAVSLLLEKSPGFLSAEQRPVMAGWLARQVDYWLNHARKSPAELPVYFHGNDSGWDNATFFAKGGPVMTPDLPTFLILACDCLATLSAGQPAETMRWRDTGNALLELMLAKLWTGETFGTRRAGDSGNLEVGESLIQFMPLLLGKRLPSTHAEKLVARLTAGGWLTQWGPATESPLSAFYQPDGYWRGPIWAPTTMLLWDGLRKQNQMDLADDIAKRYLRLCEKAGMAENFDALEGLGLRDRAFAWTSAVYLWLAASLEQNRPGPGRPV